VVTLTQGDASFARPFGSSPSPFPIDLKQRAFSLNPQVYSINPSFRTPFSLGYDVIIQREVTPTTMLELSYFGSNSFRTVRDRELNPALPDPGARSTYNSVQSRRIYQDLGSIVSAESSGRALSNSLQAQIRRRFSHGLTFQASYVLSESRDNGGPASSSFSDPLIWGRSPFDRRHNAVFSFSYDLPGLKLRHTGGLLSNWRMSGILEFRSGLPLDIYQSGIPGESDVSASRIPDLTGAFRRLDPRGAPARLANGIILTGAHLFFDPTVFSIASPALGRTGNVPRLAFDGPGFNMWSISVAKTYKLVRDHQIQIRADIRNLFNHANFDRPNTKVDSPSFGEVTSAAPGRTIQYSVRYVF
jgi:hypothetical protein